MLAQILVAVSGQKVKEAILVVVVACGLSGKRAMPTMVAASIPTVLRLKPRQVVVTLPHKKRLKLKHGEPLVAVTLSMLNTARLIAAVTIFPAAKVKLKALVVSSSGKNPTAMAVVFA